MLFDTSSSISEVDKEYIDDLISKIQLKQGTPGLDSKNIEIRKGEESLEWRYSTEVSNLVDFKSDFVKAIVNKEDIVKNLTISNLSPNAKYVQIKTVTVFGIDKQGNLVANLNPSINTAPPGKKFEYFGGFDPTRGVIKLSSNTEIDGNMSIQTVVDNIVPAFKDERIVDIAEIILRVYLLDSEMKELKQVKVSYTVNKISNNNWKNLIDLSELKGSKGEKGEQGTKGADGREIEIQKGDTHIQWKYVGDSEWKNIVSLEEIKGDTSTVEVNSEIERLNQKISELELKIEAVKLEWEDALLL